MTIAERIRALNGLPAKEVAERIGCSPQHVHSERWRQRNPGENARTNREWRRRNADHYRAYQRRKSLSTKRADGHKGKWNAGQKAKLLRLRNAGMSYSDLAIVFGVSRSCIAGILSRTAGTS